MVVGLEPYVRSSTTVYVHYVGKTSLCDWQDLMQIFFKTACMDANNGEYCRAPGQGTTGNAATNVSAIIRQAGY